MRILLDHCVDRRLARSFSNHQIKTAREMGWEQLKNGELLAKAATQFDAVLTVDQNLKHEQNLGTLPVALIVLIARSNRLADLVPVAPLVEAAMKTLAPRTYVEVSAP